MLRNKTTDLSNQPRTSWIAFNSTQDHFKIKICYLNPSRSEKRNATSRKYYSNCLVLVLAKPRLENLASGPAALKIYIVGGCRSFYQSFRAHKTAGKAFRRNDASEKSRENPKVTALSIIANAASQYAAYATKGINKFTTRLQLPSGAIVDWKPFYSDM